ncbi:GntR family transcriptional regulator [Amycolatopsis orientalis]|uniref:GntR family transcriptional regulator n=1 Tax=Amycolatopsis orientalis TaxID=31958 RepID=UPI0003F68060|nr:winged helix-turn-helix domain-containing protein [Amycolatopsis orientalis]
MGTSAGRAPFEAIADEIRDEIRRGTLKPDDKLPPHRELVAKHGVAVGTIQRALRLLQDEGLLVSRPTIGVFVSNTPAARQESITIEQLAEELADLKRRIEQLERH